MFCSVLTPTFWDGENKGDSEEIRWAYSFHRRDFSFRNQRSQKQPQTTLLLSNYSSWTTDPHLHQKPSCLHKAELPGHLPSPILPLPGRTSLAEPHSWAPPYPYPVKGSPELALLAMPLKFPPLGFIGSLLLKAFQFQSSSKAKNT